MEPRRRKSFQRDARGVALAVGIALLLRAFVVEAYSVDSESMERTLLVGDHFFVNKAIYGLRVPWTLHKLFDGCQARPGEVVLLADPRAPRGTPLIKRVVAVGGEVVELRDDRLLVDGELVPRRAIADRSCRTQVGGEARDRLPCRWFEEQLGPVRYRVQQIVGAAPSSFGPLTVPAGHVFVLGDNRSNSSDSRSWGTVPHSHLLGRVEILFWSRGTGGVRWGRLFQLVR